jgi:hypothetical protein
VSHDNSRQYERADVCALSAKIYATAWFAVIMRTEDDEGTSDGTRRHLDDY